MSFQQPLVRLIDSRVERGDLQILATSVSPAYRWYDGSITQSYIWVMDVDVGGDGTRPDANTIIKAVPIADASHGVHKSGPGARVRLQRLELTRSYEIVGLASIANGQVSVVEVTYAAGSVSIAAPQTYGSSYRVLDYDDLGDNAVNGGYRYGTLPYGTMGKYDASGNLVYVLVAP